MEVGGQLYALSAFLSHLEEVSVPLESEAWWSPELMWTFGEQKSLFSLPGIKPQIAIL
jgi:hypothetical protein